VAEDGHGGGGGLVVVDLGVGQPGVIVEDGVHERGANAVPIRGPRYLSRPAPTVAARLRLPWAAQIAPAAPVRDVPELLHVHVQQRARMVVLVPADRLTGAPVDLR
jgi:hypothetical protein